MSARARRRPQGGRPRRRAAYLLVAVVVGCVALPALPGGGDADADGPRATLSWKSRDDSGLYGYLIYRSERREGPFRRVNREIVRVAAPDDEGVSSYTWIDRDVTPGRTYYYYLDTLGTNGRKQRFSGVVAKTVAEP